jgi:hypothetical protein
MVNRSLLALVIAGSMLTGCSKTPNPMIPGIPAEHPANKFYQFVSQNMVSDKVCRDSQGDPGIPMGEVAKGTKYMKSPEIVPGVFRFRENATGKHYLGVSFLQYSGFLQIPKVCAWEEKDGK